MADKTLLASKGLAARGLAEVLASFLSCFFSWLVWGLVSFVSGVAASAISIIAKPKARANNLELIDFRLNMVNPINTRRDLRLVIILNPIFDDMFRKSIHFFKIFFESRGVFVSLY